MNNNQGSSSGLLSTLFATGGALAFAAGGYVIAKHQEAPRPESKRESERPAQVPTQESREVLAERLRHQEEKSALETNFALLQQELAGLKKAQETFQDERITLTTRLKQAEAREKTSSAQLVATAGELAEAKQTSTEQTQQISELTARAESAEAKEKASSAELLATQEKATSFLELKFTNSQNELSALQGQLTAKESQLVEAKQTSTEQTQQISELSARAESAEAKEKTSSEQLVAAQEQVTSLESNLSGSKEKVASLQVRFTELETEVEELRGLLENESQPLTEEALRQEGSSRRGSCTSQRQSSPAPSYSSMQSSVSRFDSGSDAKIRIPVFAKQNANPHAIEQGLRLLFLSRSEKASAYGLKVFLYRGLAKSAADLEPVYRLSSAHFKSEQIAEVKSLKASTDRISLYHDDFDSRSKARHLTEAGTSRFDFARQGRRGSAPVVSQHNRFDSRASDTSLISDQGEGGSRTPSFSQA